MNALVRRGGADAEVHVVSVTCCSRRTLLSKALLVIFLKVACRCTPVRAPRRGGPSACS